MSRFVLIVCLIVVSILASIGTTNQPSITTIEVYEDGSGVQYVNGQEVRTFQDGTFIWDCHVHGNRRCGK